ncbi:MAG: hypothetical protein GXP50_10985 [Deltaproteobacteria bacterium]|nr:hypothetical protein [Deltaproteobacteria bacterium]
MKSVEHTKTFEIAAPVDELFPLFSPEGEKLWVPGWDYQDVMGTPELTEDYVFITESHDHGGGRAIWVVKAYDPEKRLVEFYKIEPYDKVGVVRVRCNRISDGLTEVEVRYKYIALSPRGEAFISSFTATVYDEFVGEWKSLLETYFESVG